VVVTDEGDALEAGATVKPRTARAQSARRRRTKNFMLVSSKKWAAADAQEDYLLLLLRRVVVLSREDVRMPLFSRTAIGVTSLRVYVAGRNNDPRQTTYCRTANADRATFPSPPENSIGSVFGPARPHF